MLNRNTKQRSYTIAALASCLVIVFLFTCLAPAARGDDVILEPAMRHLRNVEPREWTEFAERAEGSELTLSFDVSDAFQPQTLRLRHRDLKQRWQIRLDDREIGALPTDENDMVTFYTLPHERLTPGSHKLQIACASKSADDVLIGEATLSARSREAWLGEATVTATVVDADGRPTPCRLTIVDEHGALMTFAAADDAPLAVRTGVAYTADGRATFSLPAGKYVLFAGRGFEYSTARAELTLQPGDVAAPRLTIVREVPTYGWVSCDTHIHTLTFSGHGDATIEERMFTLAGEGVELVIATEHNRHVDYRPFAEKLGVARYFTPVVGNEVTTDVGHFNVFPLSASAAVLDHRGQDWASVAAAIRTGDDPPIAVLNHARDIHRGFRPFDPARHLAIAGEDRDGWQLPIDAMEVVNSGATQTDPFQLFHDWLGLLNRGLSVAPIGSSDSHDVTRYIVGQGRTYIQVDDSDPGRIDVAAACRSLREGRVMAGMGLLCRATVNDAFGPGTLAPAADGYRIDVDVLGPSWTSVEEVRLYVNGIPFAQSPTIAVGNLPVGVRRRLQWSLPALEHDVHVVAIARGPGVSGAYWPIGKAYQPTSPDWQSYVVGCCGALRIDADADGKFSSPHDYARRLLESATDEATLLQRLAEFDEAVAVQAASILHARGGGRFERLVEAVDQATPPAKRGVLAYLASWKAAQPR